MLGRRAIGSLRLPASSFEDSIAFPWRLESRRRRTAQRRDAIVQQEIAERFIADTRCLVGVRDRTYSLVASSPTTARVVALFETIVVISVQYFMRITDCRLARLSGT
jgi:hypothetical protein